MFGHLHCHSSFSFLQAVPSAKALVEAAKEKGHGFLALTDSGNACGVVDATEAAEKAKIKLIIGVELWTIDGEALQEDSPAPGAQLVLLVRDAAGWKNLCQIISLAHRQRNFTPRIQLEQLREHREGIHFLTGGRYGLFRELEEGRRRLEALLEAVGKERVDVEVCDLGYDEDGPRNTLAAELAAEFSLPIVATNDVRYLSPEDSALLEAMVGIATTDPALARLSTATDQATFKSEEEMREIFPQEWIDRSGQIAEMCSFSLPRGKPMLPRVSSDESVAEIMERFPPPKKFPKPPNELPGEGPIVNRWFRWLAKEGLEIRLRDEPWALKFASKEEYFEQLEFELGVIEGMDYVVYHLIVSEFTTWAKDNDVAVGPGRGSAAGSVVVWALQITDVNPKQFGLFFERFLNPERKGLPDIDMDFEQEGRSRVIAHVREKYGEPRVGQILTISTLKAKAALKDAARVCDVHFQESNRWSNSIPTGPKVKLKDSLEHGYLAAMRSGSPLFRRVSDLALHLEGKPRQQGVHAAGVIIASDDLPDLCPMHYVPEDDLVCTGLAMEQAEKIGLVKFDFLGLKTLDVVKRAVASVVKRTGEEPTIVDPEFDDPAVFDLLCKADTDGVFQLESGGMTRLIKRLQPSCFEDVVCMLALYRPGPLKAGMVDSWVERRHGREPVDSIHPLLDEVMAPTYGLMVYQEQAIMTARILAGFSLGSADLMRRAIGKKKPEEMAVQRSLFVRGCKETNGIDEADANRIFNIIDYFSGYGFNKCIDTSTPVVTARGIVRADEVVVGDEILEMSCGRFQKGEVRRVWPVEQKERIKITFDDGSFVICTAEHRFVDYDSRDEIQAGEAASAGRRLSFLEEDGATTEGGRVHVEVRPSAQDKRRAGVTPEELRGVCREAETDPAGDHEEGLGDAPRRTEGLGIEDREADLGAPGCAGRKGGEAPGVEGEGAREVQDGVHREDVGGEEGEPTGGLLPRGDCVGPAPRVQKECPSQGRPDGEAGGLPRGVHGGGRRAPPLPAAPRQGKIRDDDSAGPRTDGVGEELQENPGEGLSRLLHELGSHQAPVEGSRRGHLEAPPGWRVAPRRPVRVDQLAVGPVVDLEVGGDHLFVLGNGLISHNSHSAAYAVISYMTAKLKAHHRADFMAASMTLDMGNRDKVRQYVASCRRSGIRLLPPDVNQSNTAFSEENGSVRFGLGAIKGIGEAVLPQLLSNRPYSSVTDLIERGGAKKAIAETLVWAGALDAIEPDRFEAWWKLRKKAPKKPSKKFAASQLLMFGGGKTAGEVKDEEDALREQKEKPPRPTVVELSDKEVSVLGVTLGEHPLKTFEDVASRVRTHSIDDLSRLGPEKIPFVLVCRVETVEIDEDRRGDSVAFVSLEDGGGSIEVVLRSDALKATDRETTLVVGACVAVHGVADAYDPDNPRIVVDRLEPLPEFRWRVGRTVEVEIKESDRELLSKMRELLDKTTDNGTHEVVVVVEEGGEEKRLLLDRKICPSDELVVLLERLCGRPNVMRIPYIHSKEEKIPSREEDPPEYDIVWSDEEEEEKDD